MLLCIRRCHPVDNVIDVPFWKIMSPKILKRTHKTHTSQKSMRTAPQLSALNTNYLRFSHFFICSHFYQFTFSFLLMMPSMCRINYSFFFEMRDAVRDCYFSFGIQLNVSNSFGLNGMTEPLFCFHWWQCCFFIICPFHIVLIYMFASNIELTFYIQIVIWVVFLSFYALESFCGAFCVWIC